MIDQLREFGEVRRGWLGVRIQNVDETTAEALDMKDGVKGALVAGVDEKGPAKAAGLEIGDVIVKFNGTAVKSSSDLPRIVASTPVGKTVDVLVIRKGAETTKSVTLGRLEDTEKPTARQRQAAGGRERRAPGARPQPVGHHRRGPQRYSLKDGLKGVLVTRVDPNSTAADKQIKPGEVIVEVGQEAVNAPADVTQAHRPAQEGRPQVGAAPRRRRPRRRPLRGARDRLILPSRETLRSRRPRGRRFRFGRWDAVPRTACAARRSGAIGLRARRGAAQPTNSAAA